LYDVTPCSVVEIYRRSRGTCLLHFQDGCSRFLWNLGKLMCLWTFIDTPVEGVDWAGTVSCYSLVDW